MWHTLFHWFLIFMGYWGFGWLVYTILYALEATDELPQADNVGDVLIMLFISVVWLPVVIAMCFISVFTFIFKTYPKTLEASREKVREQKIKMLANKVRRQQKKSNSKKTTVSLPGWF